MAGMGISKPYRLGSFAWWTDVLLIVSTVGLLGWIVLDQFSGRRPLSFLGGLYFFVGVTTLWRFVPRVIESARTSKINP